jgi:hypothetical protein
MTISFSRKYSICLPVSGISFNTCLKCAFFGWSIQLAFMKMVYEVMFVCHKKS